MSEFIVEPAHIVGGFPFGFPLLIALDDSLVLSEFHPTGASPSTAKSTALLTFILQAFSSYAVMLLERMFA
jgi:hypothetical protein